MELNLVKLVYSNPKPEPERVRKGRGGAHKAKQAVSDYVASKYPSRKRINK